MDDARNEFLTETVEHQSESGRDGNLGRNFVSVFVAGQLFGIPVLTVQAVLGPQPMTRIPLAPPEVAGSLNLRGRIVTAIDLRTRLGLEPRSDGDGGMNVVVEVGAELYSLIVDSVGEAQSFAAEDYEHTPATLDPRWCQIVDGIYRLDDRLMIVADVTKLIEMRYVEAA